MARRSKAGTPSERWAADQSMRFLELLFSTACDEGLWFSIFCLKSGRSKFFDRVDGMVVDYCMDQCYSLKQDVYACMGLFREPIKGRGRGSEVDTFGLAAFFSDLDAKKAPCDTTRPSTEDEVIELAKVGPHKPSLSVRSGSLGHIHPYWLLKEPLIWVDEEGRREARDLLDRFHLTLCSLWATKGYSIDSVNDLVRVLRVPGTLNWKDPENPARVEIIASSTGGGGEGQSDWTSLMRFEADDFDPYLVEKGAVQTSYPGKHSEVVSYLELDPEATVDKERLMLAGAASEAFKRTWNKQRPEFSEDANRYDQAIANALVGAGWSDQDVADAITHWRREMFGKPKVDSRGRLRLDYYQRTILKAKNAAREEEAKERLSSGDLLLSRDEEGDLSGKDRKEVLSSLRSLLGVEIESIVQVGVDDPEYRLKLSGREEFILGDDKAIESFTIFRRAVRAHSKLTIKPAARKLWDVVYEHFNAIMTVDATFDPTRVDRLISSFEHYYPSISPTTYDDARVDDSCPPFSRDGSFYVNLRHYSKWYREETGKSASSNELASLFKLAGGRQTKVNFEAGDGLQRRQSRYWKFDSMPSDGSLE